METEMIPLRTKKCPNPRNGYVKMKLEENCTLVSFLQINGCVSTAFVKEK